MVGMLNMCSLAIHDVYALLNGGISLLLHSHLRILCKKYVLKNTVDRRGQCSEVIDDHGINEYSTIEVNLFKMFIAFFFYFK